MARDLVNGLLEPWRLYLIVSGLDGVACSLQELLVEFVVEWCVAQHELEILINVLSREGRGWRRRSVRFLEHLRIEYERRVVDEGDVTVGDGRCGRIEG